MFKREEPVQAAKVSRKRKYDDVVNDLLKRAEALFGNLDVNQSKEDANLLYIYIYIYISAMN